MLKNKLGMISVSFLLASAFLPMLAHAQTSVPTASSTKGNSRNHCMATAAQKRKEAVTTAQSAFDSAHSGAVQTRDAAIASAKTAYDAARSSAVKTRDSALSAAKSNTDKPARVAAIKVAGSAYKDAVSKTRTDFRNAQQAAWSIYRDANKKARTDFQTTRKAAGDQFNTDRQACPKK